MLGCGGGGEGRETLRERLVPATDGGGGISALLPVLLELDAASKGCLGAGLFEARTAFGPGAAELLLDSPIVIRMNSLMIPSSLYASCSGFEGRE